MHANVARYHSGESPSPAHENYSNLDKKTRIIVSKLAAIIRLADALDKSHKQKIKDMSVKYSGNEVIVSVKSDQDLLLEQWTFENKSEFFKKVFGVTPLLITKKVISNV